jgi:hypothetical protein
MRQLAAAAAAIVRGQEAFEYHYSSRVKLSLAGRQGLQATVLLWMWEFDHFEGFNFQFAKFHL